MNELTPRAGAMHPGASPVGGAVPRLAKAPPTEGVPPPGSGPAAGRRGRIILINRYFYPDLSATSQMVSSLAFELTARGFAVHAIASRQRYDDAAAALPRHETIRGVTIHRVGTSSLGRGRLGRRAVDYATFHLAAAAAVVSDARPGDCVVACTDPPMLSVTVQSVLPPGTLLVNWLLDLFPEVAFSLQVKGVLGIAPLLRRLRNRSLAKAARNVVIGGRMAALLTDQGISPNAITVIPNCSDGSLVRPLPREAVALRREWRLGNRFVVGYSGNMGRAHEFGTVIDAADRLRGDPGILFLFVGDGHRLAEIRRAVAERNLPNVLFRPLQSEERLCETLGAMDVHLVTLRPELEGLIIPSKIYGIAAAGRPALFVGDRQGEVGAMLHDHDFGSAFAIGDADGLAEAIHRLSTSPTLCRRLGDNARRAFDEQFDRRHVVEKWLALLDGLPAGTRAPPTGRAMRDRVAAERAAAERAVGGAK
ncbi:glycosyltransferase family 4 protein [Azospirillum picis]|uniref:Glycosyltransferase involved in cell wall biosynthesis n=1 Tax=Azospirillum picis TaxID=488438 RepID=A0ABU0MRL0_9PROT|nr:glycosyltransferase family 4 protein [Azospirillum picis]MBP2300853.1 glycosyltransferase involved in cell wall biosynthesis [Azospirillum picis]MDQ0536110.1 glycosyltransferase involved in cell wall biosynthesis [Azospirillum picis]